MRVRADDDGWLVTPPSHRFDIAIEADLIEELARIVGFEAIAEADAIATPEGARRSPNRRRSSRRRWRSWRRAAIRKRSPTRSSIRRCRANCFPGVVTAGAQQSDRQRHGGHARVVVAGAHQGGAGESATPAGSHPPVRTWRAFRGGGVETDLHRRHRHGLAAAGAVGRQAQRRWISST